MIQLQNFKTMVDELKSTNSRNKKMEILAKYPENKPLLQIVMDPFQKFNVTIKSILKYFDVFETENETPSIGTKCEDLIKLLTQLATRELSGNKALHACCQFIYYSKIEDKGYLLHIFNKKLEIRLGDKEINKVFPNLIPTYEVCLAQTCDDKLLAKIRLEPEMWVIMRKLDGLRNVAEYEKLENICKSRNGHEFTSLAKINQAIENMMLVNEKEDIAIAGDGEICVIDEDGNEDFTAAVSQVKKKDKTMKNPKYVMFDLLPLKDFRDLHCDLTYLERLQWLKSLLEEQNSPYLSIIEWWPFTDENYKKAKEVCAKEGWEGLMLRKNVAYEGKRTKNLLKVKEFFEAEFQVMGHKNGPFRVINKATGLEETIQTLASVTIMYKGKYPVDVGSGFSLDQRKAFYNDLNLIIGKTITVQYFEESKNSSGGLSLRFPTIKKIWENGRDV